MKTEPLKEFEHLPKLAPPFKNYLNQRYSKQLFYEQWITLEHQYRTMRPAFTLNTNVEGLVNFGRRYIADADMTGYTTTISLLGEFEYFDHLMKAPWFREAKEKWDKELEAILYAEGMRTIREMAKGDDAKALQAAKVLLRRENYNPNKKTVVKRGRPTNEEVEGQLKIETKEAQEIDNDLARIRLVQSNGDK